ncbi:hypothetical protein [Afifella marina]|uniref:Saccharopine dehydrogenase NADP binding domain-containing protein n=1 Tax=Afifella marina DSM 2698 TaxID=1120955 RepID=A0A1G5MF03_AFIMA|nr:hypothetical protein [Afifella marina]MBK1622605.1 hypothetical protein [Afifella marina DSM 2698]MBK1625600.1 hypothetical protein [Afifella marina]MBK5917423.1 hypothetical protein [Afifella marina]RAI23372.1 hypothetical protein CH311_00320 [Afifella marina DSM 2698]SCZ23098.1 hypothetical protein SAMN03080610_00489 [Afifella marina DSM 2698]
MSVDVLVTGTGMFAGRIVLDIAATAKHPVTVMVAGRNTERLDWLRTAGNARARMFGTPARVVTHRLDLLEEAASEQILEIAAPRIVVQAASIQTSAVIAQTGNRWSQLVADGGLSATAIFQALISSRMAAAISQNAPGTHFINCSFPDVVNGLIAAMGHRVLCGTGNVAILSNVFDGAEARGALGDGALRVLAHYQCLAPWRRKAEDRKGAPAPRVFVGDSEIDDVFATFADVRLTPEPAIEVSGASGVTLILALAAGLPWSGHVPGPNGLPGGYPVALRGDALSLDLPNGVSEDEAVAWNDAFETQSGLTVEGTKAVFHGRLAELLEREGFAHAQGFDVQALEAVCEDMLGLRDRLLAQPQD